MPKLIQAVYRVKNLTEPEGFEVILFVKFFVFMNEHRKLEGNFNFFWLSTRY